MPKTSNQSKRTISTVEFQISKFIIFISFLPCVFTAYANLYGMRCDWNPEVCSLDPNLECSLNNKCECVPFAEKQFDENATIRCVNVSIEIIETNSNLSSDCYEGENCTSVVFNSTCKGGLVPIAKENRTECKTPLLVPPNEDCFIGEEEAHICDDSKYSHCRNSICSCLPGYYFNKNKEECMIKPDILRKFAAGGAENIKYVGDPGEPCLGKDYCLIGLVCNSLSVCDCPSACPFKGKEGICDCEEVANYAEAPPPFYWVGIIFGLVSSFCLFSVIRKTFNRLRTDLIEKISAEKFFSTSGQRIKKDGYDFDNPAFDAGIESQNNNSHIKLSRVGQLASINRYDVQLPVSYISLMKNLNNIVPGCSFTDRDDNPPIVNASNLTISPKHPLYSNLSLPYVVNPVPTHLKCSRTCYSSPISSENPKSYPVEPNI